MPEPKVPKCDICESTAIKWVYPAKTFTIYILGIPYTSRHDWAICEICDELIENQGAAGTVQRAMETCYAYADPNDPELKACLTEFHKQFFANRIGSAYPYTPGCMDNKL